MEGIMKGIVKEKEEMGAVYRRDLKIPEIGANDVLVKVKATAICGTDMHIYNWTKWAQDRLVLPMVFGHEFSGDIVEAGSAVKSFKVGDRIAGETHIPCNKCYQCQTGNQHICENMKIIGVHTPGAFSEYISIPQDCVWRLDDEISYEIGALLEPMGVGVHGVLSGEIGGKSVLISGCGPIGLMAIGAASANGASKIYAIDIFDGKLEIAKKMGADIAINSRAQDYIKVILEDTKGQGVDVVIDYTGNGSVIANSFKALKKGGRYTLVGLPDKEVSLDLTESIIYKEAVVNGVTGREMYKTWWQCNSLLKSGKFDINPVIGGVYKMEEFEKAFAELKKGAHGKMLLIP
ncbi:MAG: L-threonine 3-dehydrogenase [Clostridiaceae bacterium]|nr:L-threonine 3-dehydrogenase [Clostridiaceae bacterium]